MAFEVRPMAVDDVEASAATFEVALRTLLAQQGLPPRPEDPTLLADTASRVGHLLGTDPSGSWVATEASAVVAFTQAIRRDACWVLVHLFVRPEVQSSRLGGRLLAQACAYGSDAPVGLIGATSDPRAIRSYARLPGFRTLPTLNASGPVRQAGLDPALTRRIRDGEPGDVAEGEELDRRLRGGSRAVDVAYLVGRGHRWRVLPGRGYAVHGPGVVDVLSAVDAAAAVALLTDALLHQPEGTTVAVSRMTAEQQWAFPVLLAAGLELRPWGPLVVRGLEGAPTPYLPSPSMC